MHIKGHPLERHHELSPQERLDLACSMFETAIKIRIQAIQSERQCTRDEALRQFREEWARHNLRKVERWAASLVEKP